MMMMISQHSTYQRGDDGCFSKCKYGSSKSKSRTIKNIDKEKSNDMVSIISKQKV